MIRWRSKYNGWLKESDNKVEGSSPIKNFLQFLIFFAFAKMQVIFRNLHVCRKKNMIECIMHMQSHFIQ